MVKTPFPSATAPDNVSLILHVPLNVSEAATLSGVSTLTPPHPLSEVSRFVAVTVAPLDTTP